MTLFVDIWMLSHQYALGNAFFSAIHVDSGVFVFHLRVKEAFKTVKEKSSNTLVSFLGFPCFFVCLFVFIKFLLGYLKHPQNKSRKIVFLGLSFHAQ